MLIVLALSMQAYDSPLVLGEKEQYHPGRQYYEDTIDHALKYRWNIGMTLFSSCAYEGYDAQGMLRPLAAQLFAPCVNSCNEECAVATAGDRIRIRDIYLLSRLSDDNKMRSRNINALAPQRPGAATDPFGAYRSDQYLALIAPTELQFDAEAREEGINLSAVYQHELTDFIVAYVGMNIPIKSRLHVLDLSLYNGSLFNETFASNSTVRSNPLIYFHQNFIDVYDFVQRTIFESRGICFQPRQRKTGVGDVSFFGVLDFGRYLEHMDSLQFGFNVVAPSGGKTNGTQLWDPCLGNGGAVQFEGFVSLIFNSPIRAFNPAIRVVGAGSLAYTNNYTRIPESFGQSITSRTRIDTVPGLLGSSQIMNEQYGDYYVDPFNEIATAIPAFADNTVQARIKQGPRAFIGVGNYFYNVFSMPFRLGVFYDFSLKGKDSVTTTCCPTREAFVGNATAPAVFNTQLLEDCSETRMHRIGWNLTYKFENLLELNIGSEHVIGGQNVARYHEVFTSLIVTF